MGRKARHARGDAELARARTERWSARRQRLRLRPRWSPLPEHLRFALAVLTVWGLGLCTPTPARSQVTPGDSERALPSKLEPTAPAPRTRGVTQPPRALGDLSVAYPAEARGDARVLLELIVGEDGEVEQARALSGEPPFSHSAQVAARSWSFEPALSDAQPVRVRIHVEVHFKEPAAVAEPDALPAAPLSLERKPPNLPQLPSSPGVEPKNIPTTRIDRVEAQPLEVTVQGEGAKQPKQLTRAEVRQLPGAFGDAFRAIEALPGVTPIASGAPYFYVRGSPPGNVGYFLDGIEVPYLFHAVIGPSVIHPAFIDRVSLYSGAYPARYGRFAGGIVAGETAPPSYAFRGELSLRLVDSGGLFELPFADGRGSVMVGGRYSYTAFLVSLFAPEIELGYWDYQGRVAYRLSSSETLTLFGFGARDFLSDEDDEGKPRDLIDVTFHRLEARYGKIVSARSEYELTANLGIDQTAGNDEESDGFDLQAKSFNARFRHSYQLDARTELHWGGAFITRNNQISVDDDFGGEAQQGEVDDADELRLQFPSRRDFVTGAHAEFALGLGRVTLTGGLRFDVYRSERRTFLAPEPRLQAKFRISEALALRHDLGLAHQAPSTVIPIPGFTPGLDLGLQRALQNSAGLEWKLPWEVTATASVFHTLLFNGTDALGVSRLDNGDPNIDNETDRVRGRSVGFELYLSRSLTQRLGGFLSYTLSRAERAVGRAEGPSTFDRTHVLNLALAYDLGRRWRLGTRLTTYTGIPADVAYLAAAKRPPRTRPFYRIDARLEKRWLLGNSGAWWALVFEALNSTANREVLNASCYAYGCRADEIGPVIVPSIGVEASF